MTDPERPLGPRFDRALALATRVHAGQRRKGTSIPYISHPLTVAALVMEHGGSEVEVAAALLHDAAEDGGSEMLPHIEAELGQGVAAIVRGCTDSVAEPRPPWIERKRGYLAHVRGAPPSVQLVSCADKLHNARAILADYRALGAALWSRFSGGRDGVLWYYTQLAALFRLSAAPPRLSAELLRTVSELTALVEAREQLPPQVPIPDGLEVPEALWSEVRARYREPARGYHSFEHVRDVLYHFAAIDAEGGWTHPADVWFAIVCHDAVYEAGRSDNEARSAELARQLIDRYGLAAGGQGLAIDADRVCELIELTARHGHLDPGSVTGEQALFVDCDMAILGAAPGAFAAFEAGVRAEYTRVLTAEQYAAGRRAFLERLATAEHVFLSPRFRSALGDRARANLEAAVIAAGGRPPGYDAERG